MNDYIGDWYSAKRALWLNKVVLSDDGRPVSGWVVNGNWYWRLKENEEWACYSDYSEKPVNSWEPVTDDWEKCK